MAPTNKADAVYCELRHAIETGALPAGAGLGEEAIVARLGASRTPVRAALVRLEAEGLAQRSGARGMLQVAPLTRDDVEDLFGVRAMLEGAAFRTIAQAIAAGEVDPSPLRSLRSAVDNWDAGTGAMAPEVFYRWAEQFDAAVVALTPNRLLAKAIAAHRPLSARARLVAHRCPERVAVSAREHLRMLEALLSGDPSEAEAACLAHLASVEEAVLFVLDAGGAASTAAGPTA